MSNTTIPNPSFNAIGGTDNNPVFTDPWFRFFEGQLRRVNTIEANVTTLQADVLENEAFAFFMGA